MTQDHIYKIWTEFLEDYKDYLLSNEELWITRLEEIKKYIDLNKKIPSYNDKNREIKSLGNWIIHQISNYKSKKNSMSDTNIYNTWIQFISSDKYNEYFTLNDEV